jgi:hypothetical protein
LFVWSCFLWLGRGLTIKSDEQSYNQTRWQYVKHMWFMSQSLAAIKMQHLFTFEEVLKELHEKITFN